jgi:hypothetical protein
MYQNNDAGLTYDPGNLYELSQTFLQAKFQSYVFTAFV